jgi:hypothetical protein
MRLHTHKLKRGVMDETAKKVITKIYTTFNKYEDKEAIKLFVLSKKLWKYLGKPEKLDNPSKDRLPLSVMVEETLQGYTFFFGTNLPYTTPAAVHSIEFNDATYPAIQVNRIVKSLSDEVTYETKIIGGMRMEEIGFCLAEVIKQMDSSNHCKKEDMLKIIGKYLETK